MKALKIILALYILLGIGVYSIQKKFIFNPEFIEQAYKFNIGQEVEIPLEDGISMNTLLVKDEVQPSKGVILYLHGNRGSIRFGTYQIRQMKDLGYDILIPDYRSYGKTEGKICCEEQLLKDCQKAYDYLKTQYTEKDITIVGYSLGTGFASYLASRNNPSNLILIAPFTSLTDIKNKYLWFLPDFLLRFKLPVKAFLKNTKCPITIVHGEKDNIVDFNFSKELKETYGDQVDFISAPDEGHRRIIFSSALKHAIIKRLGN